MRVALNKNYDLCGDNCIVISKARTQTFGQHTRFMHSKKVEERVLKPSKSGYVRISCHQSINVRKKYKELFGKEWEG